MGCIDCVMPQHCHRLPSQFIYVTLNVKNHRLKRYVRHQLSLAEHDSHHFLHSTLLLAVFHVLQFTPKLSFWKDRFFIPTNILTSRPRLHIRLILFLPYQTKLWKPTQLSPVGVGCYLPTNAAAIAVPLLPLPTPTCPILPTTPVLSRSTGRIATCETRRDSLPDGSRK